MKVEFTVSCPEHIQMLSEFAHRFIEAEQRHLNPQVSLVQRLKNNQDKSNG